MIYSVPNVSNKRTVVNRLGLLAALSLLLPCPAVVYGQNTISTVLATGVAKASNLQTALAAAAAPEDGLALAIDAEKLLLPNDSVMPRPGEPVSQVVIAFKYSERRFGRITAVAPPTMTVLNPDPGQPNIYQNIPARQAFIFLVANLNNGQRQQLISEQGLGMIDLTTDLQRNLFQALFPVGNIEVSPRLQPGQQPDQTAYQDITDWLPQARLRVGQAVEMDVATIGQDTRGLVPKFASPNGPHVYDFQVNRMFDQDVVDGVRVRSTLPNTPKKSDLDYNAPRMRTLVSLDQLKTVGDLVGRIGTIAHYELYADKHYENRTLTLVGHAQSAAAGDLLRALTYCLTGTFRRVGPAYILTDDLIGVGTRRRHIYELEADADAQRQGPLADAEGMLQKTKAMWNRNADWFGDPLAATPEQMQQRDDNMLGAGAFTTLHLPFNQLTPDQQGVLQSFSDQMIKAAASHPGQGSPGIDYDKNVDFYIQPCIQILVPGLDGPVDTDLGQWVSDMFHDMSRWHRPRNSRPQAQPNPAPEPVGTTTGMLSALIQPIAHRAVLVHPSTTAEIDTIVKQMQNLGLNQLWLTVFTADGGRVPDSGLTFGPVRPGEPDLLAYALQATRDKGIAVYAVCDLLTWGATTPPDLLDLTVLGETSAQDEERRYQRNLHLAKANGTPPPGPPPSGLVVSPFAPGVQQRLAAFVRRLAAYPGIAGLVWRKTDPSGYDVMWESFALEHHAQLGYTEPARLAFLRQAHADPVDITPHRTVTEFFERASMRLPNFDDWQIDADLALQWNQFRTTANKDLLHSLYTAAGKDGAPPPTIYLRERRSGYGATWFGSWDGTEATLPTHHNAFESAAPRPQSAVPQQPVESDVKQAKAQSKLALVRLPISDSLDERNIMKQWEQAFHNILQNEGWDGFVLDTEGGP